ncbi:transmembrane amino acid transporter protein-domain-containing protein [Hysterangium stoloniferum]|nr:transmembrane amino acid transporter protein-domain-containing protein [Hysterangium stoloniferum]
MQLSISPASSTLSEVVSSYRRAQTFISSSYITTQDGFPEYLRHGEGSINDPYNIETASVISEAGIARTPHAEDVTDPLWDDTFQPRSDVVGRARQGDERTPLLLKKKLSWHHGLQSHNSIPQTGPGLLRRTSTRSFVSARPQYYFQGGNSTYRQTLFNAIAILVGIGMLSEPLAFAYAGWITGTALIILYGFITCYTAKILARIIADDLCLKTYADIACKAFGHRSIVVTGLLFCLELFAVGVVLVTLYADSFHLVVPALTSNQFKLLGLAVIIPTIFLPLSILSYASILGILSTTLIILCITIDGLMKREAPGSMWDPAETHWVVTDTRKIGVSFGLFMASFGGHAVMPSLARDMQDPSQFDHMINWAFGVATALYGIIGAAGYFMFGDSVQEEISKNILETPGYPALLNNVTVWMLVIAPLSKFALNIRPLNLTIEIWLGIDNTAMPPSASRPASPTTKSAAVLETSLRTTSRPLLLIIERSCVTLLAVGVSIMIPEFSTMMAFLGSFSAFVICVIGPISAKVAIERKCSIFDGVLLGMCCIFTVWGTVAAFQ